MVRKKRHINIVNMAVPKTTCMVPYTVVVRFKIGSNALSLSKLFYDWRLLNTEIQR